MKHFFTLALLSLTFSTYAQKKLTRDQFHDRILTAFNDVFSNRSLETVDEYFTSDFLILEHGEVWTKDTVINVLRQALRSGQKRTRINRINVIEFERKGSTAWGSYWNEAEISFNDGPVRKVKWLESAVLVRQKGKWKMKLLHSTRIS